MSMLPSGSCGHHQSPWVFWVYIVVYLSVCLLFSLVLQTGSWGCIAWLESSLLGNVIVQPWESSVLGNDEEQIGCVLKGSSMSDP